MLLSQKLMPCLEKCPGLIYMTKNDLRCWKQILVVGILLAKPQNNNTFIIVEIVNCLSCRHHLAHTLDRKWLNKCSEAIQLGDKYVKQGSWADFQSNS